jgi:hypothetical protein
VRISRLAEKEGGLHTTHSIDEAEENQERKSKDSKTK